MQKMQPIIVNRYHDPEAVGYVGTIEPEDRSWVVFVPTRGHPSLWVLVDDGPTDDEGTEGVATYELADQGPSRDECGRSAH